ncbi:hypothetical protein A7D21_00215 [Pseudomonas sp. AP19]|uniref:hypothetical protein n=1 Tax=Pseudomonas TaxID=286 RepID=UPI00084AD39D|nr:hypothetical protein [Pseudomonas sp. AP19]OEC69816.1 hypothetical protein A7D21_00215 [Pseudomonas sp. AP19]
MAQGYINDRTTDYHSLKSRLIGPGISPQRSEHFDVLNRHLRRGLVSSEQLVIVPDAHSLSYSLEEAWLVRHAEAIRRELDNAAGTQVSTTMTYCNPAGVHLARHPQRDARFSS